MEAPDTWSFQFATEELGKDVASNLLTIDTLLYGRRTYEEMAAAWPSRTGVMADQFNGIAKYAVSTTLSEVTWNNSTLIKENVAEEVSQLKQRPGQDILILGSADLVHFLKLHDLIDEYWLSVYPIILGSGKHLFQEGGKMRLQLVSSKAYKTGIVRLIYQPIRE